MKMLEQSAMIACILTGLAGSAFAQSAADNARSTQVDEVVRAQIREQNIPGVSLAVMRDGKIIKAAGYGRANVELNVPMEPQMLLHTESLAKAFTATAVMMLVEEGKIGLDDKIAKYLPEAPPIWNEVTIRRLLTHTSGIRDYFGEDGDPTIDLHRGFTEDELVRSFAAQTLRFPTGEKWSYCNAGYVILGVVIHRVTGKFWFDFVKERIFDPLGMTATRLISPEDIIMNRASGYQILSGEWKNEPGVAPEWKTADGMLYTNVFDMAKWDAALYSDTLIKRSSLEQMWTPVKLNDGTTYPYGFGWRIREVNGHRLIQHDGVGPAFTTRFARYVNDRLSIIVLINLGEDEEALIPTRMTDSVAAIYIPSLGDSKSQTSMSDTPPSTASVPRIQPPSAETSSQPPEGEAKAVEETVRAYEQAIQQYDFAKAGSFLAPDAKWIEENSYPEAADRFDDWWQEAKRVKLRLENHPHDFDIGIQGDVAWVVVYVDATTVIDNEAARAFTLRDHPNERSWIQHFVESEVLVKTSKGWKIAMGHTSRLPAR